MEYKENNKEEKKNENEEDGIFDQNKKIMDKTYLNLEYKINSIKNLENHKDKYENKNC